VEVPGIERISGWEENLIWAVSDIAQLRSSFARDSADVFIEKLRSRTLFEATESARYLGAWRCANLERFFREIGLELEAGRDPHDLSRRLRTAVATEEVAEEGRPADLMADAVKVMTIHGAKGLGFEHVYLMQLHKGVGGGPERLTQAAELAGGFEYRLLGAPTLSWDCVLRERERSSEAERVRLLYVAMTRAKQRLVLTGLWPDHQQRSPKGQAMEHVRPRIESTEGLADWLSGPALDETPEFVDRFGARWSLPVLETSAESASLEARVNGSKLPSEAELTDASRRLAGLRASATERMSRPMSATASARGHDERVEGGGARRGEAESGGNGADSRAIGCAIHRALEEFDFSADVEVEIERQRDAVARNLAQTTASDDADATVTAGTQLWGRIVQGSLFAQLRELSDRIIARELSVLSPPTGAEGPVGYLTGLVDLVYRDPADDQLVVVDYKTDSVLDADAIQSRADTYAEQGAVYRYALQDALELSYTPRFELWFLQADEIRRY
jgi:ATP-dependent helicase/nuclease subunit A